MELDDVLSSDTRQQSGFGGIGVDSIAQHTLIGYESWHIAEGRIAVLVDGVPSALIVPYIFAEYFQSLDDYSNRAYFATFTRLLKYCAFFISVMLPGLFVALGTFEPEMFPTLMLNKIAASIASTPLSLTAETILILFIYEIMREAGLRMPRPLGYAVSIVGGNIQWKTRVMTTAIMLETNKGRFSFALALGLILLMIAFIVNILASFIVKEPADD